MESVARVREEVKRHRAPNANDSNKRQRVVSWSLTEATASRTESKLPASQTEAKDWPRLVTPGAWHHAPIS